MALSAASVDVIARATAALPSISLADVIEQADLQTRVDRKYLVPAEVAGEILAASPMAMLEIDGRRLFRYESVYFDTADLLCYRRHASGRRVRHKVRTRSYLDSGLCALEVKAKGGRGETVKERLTYELDNRDRLTSDGREFVASHWPDPAAVAALAPVLTTVYHRGTFVDVAHGHRLTVDLGLTFSHGRSWHVGPGHLALVETKAAGSATPIDHALWRAGYRPASLSKYCVGLAVLRPWLHANRWNRVLRHDFGWEPVTLPLSA